MSLDWGRVKLRLAKARTALEQALSPPHEQIQLVYEERARALAQRQHLQQRRATVPLLVCTIGGERCALEVRELAEVLAMPGCVPVPGAPPFLLGAFNLRGDIRLAADAARLLELPPPQSAGYLLMLRERSVGLRVQDIHHILWLSADDAALVGGGTEAALPWVRGITSDGLKLVSLAAVWPRLCGQTTKG